MLSLSANGMAASTAYVDTTGNLDLNQIQFVVVASPDFRAQLHARATMLFAKAGLPLPASDESHPPIATLTLTLDPHPLGDTCPGKVLYTPSLALTEPVIIPRNAVVMNDMTWLLATETHVREPVALSRLEADLDGFIGQFITDYKAGNPGRHSEEKPSLTDNLRTDHKPARPVVSEKNDAQGTAGLKNLNVNTLQVFVLAGRSSEALTARALHQLNEAGLRVAPERNANSAVTLGIELTQRSLDDHCPGTVLYERGIYLVEQVLVMRSPRVSLWSDTWLRETTQVVPPVPPHQLASDQDALIQQFIRSFQAK